MVRLSLTLCLVLVPGASCVRDKKRTPDSPKPRPDAAARSARPRTLGKRPRAAQPFEPKSGGFMFVFGAGKGHYVVIPLDVDAPDSYGKLAPPELVRVDKPTVVVRRLIKPTLSRFQRSFAGKPVDVYAGRNKVCSAKIKQLMWTGRSCFHAVDFKALGLQSLTGKRGPTRRLPAGKLLKIWKKSKKELVGLLQGCPNPKKGVVVWARLSNLPKPDLYTNNIQTALARKTTDQAKKRMRALPKFREMVKECRAAVKDTQEKEKPVIEAVLFSPPAGKRGWAHFVLVKASVCPTLAGPDADILTEYSRIWMWKNNRFILLRGTSLRPVLIGDFDGNERLEFLFDGGDGDMAFSLHALVGRNFEELMETSAAWGGECDFR